MAKKVSAIVKLQIHAGKATAGRGCSALGPHGVNMMEFIKGFNERTASQVGMIIQWLSQSMKTVRLPLLQTPQQRFY